MEKIKKKITVPGLHPLQLMQLHEEMLLLAAVVGMDATFEIEIVQGIPQNLAFTLEVDADEVGMVDEFQKKFDALGSLNQMPTTVTVN